MPPKSGKKKLTKAEKEKLKKEDAERKAREEEEARIQAEKEEAERKVRDKQEAEERRQLENEERKKRKGQLQELDDIWDSNRSTLLSEQAEKRRKDRWARYMLCDGTPDPMVHGEINTYMNLWREDLENIDITAVLKDSEVTLNLIEELSNVMDITPESEMSQTERSAYSQTLVELEHLLKAKLDIASFDVFRQATDFQNSETLNLQKVIGNDDITLCAWGNLSKNPRIKSHEFEEVGITFEVPRVLTLSDCAIRILLCKFDHNSKHSSSFYPRHKTALEESVEEEKTDAEADAAEKDEDEKEDGDEKADEEEGVNREETQDVLAALNALDGDEAEEKTEEEEKPEEEPMEEDVEIKTPEPEEFEDFDGEEDAIDLRANQVLGGVFHLNLLHLPPQPKLANSWVITQVMDPPALSYMDYIADNMSPGNQSSDPKKQEDQKDRKDAEKPPIGVVVNDSDQAQSEVAQTPEPSKRLSLGVNLRLPEDVYFSEEPQVVRWDEDHNIWRMEGFSDHSYQEEKRILSFKTSYFGTMALVQDTYINMPFQSWELRPRATNHAQLTIIAAIVEVEIQIKDDLLCLSQPDDKPELEHLVGRWYNPQTFVKKMQASGLNLFPSCDSTKYVSIQSKNAITEERMYQQMALVASSMAFSWSKWNSDVQEQSTDRILVQATEQLQDEPLMEEDWSVWMVTKKRTTKLKMTEFDENFSEDHAEGTEFNADMYHMAMELASEDAKERIRSSNHRFIDSVYSLLRGTRVLTYS